MAEDASDPRAEQDRQLQAMMEEYQRTISPALDRLNEQMVPLMEQMQQQLGPALDAMATAGAPSLEELQRQLVPVLAQLEAMLKRQETADAGDDAPADLDP